MFYFNMEPRLKWSKNVLAPRTFSVHFRRGFISKYNSFKDFYIWAAAIGHPS